jgi:hypothetical protein
MKTVRHEFFTLFILFCLLLTPIKSYSQESEKTDDISLSVENNLQDSEIAKNNLPPKRHFFTDLNYTILGITSSNLFLNYVNRLANTSFANMTFESIWDNIYADPDWMWEYGDRFHVNQIGHAYLGAVYFASSRINGFNFYESIPAVFLGSVMWEVIFEPEPAYNDVITTTISGMAFGEMLYRLFLEVDSKKTFGAKIGGFFISPSSSHNKIYNRPVFEKGGGNIYDLTLRSGVEKSFSFFPNYEEHEDSWKYPGGRIDVNAVYGDPFLQQSKKAYDHFELFAGITLNNLSYHASIISDGYIFSINPEDTDKKTTSTGLSMHFDVFNASNDFLDNAGYGNIHFSSSAIGWTVKHKYLITEKSHLEIKTHANATLWGNSIYNTDIKDTAKEYWYKGDAHCIYGIGENIKFSFSLFHKKAGRLNLKLYGYHFFAIPVNEDHLKGNMFFLYGSFNYDFPFTEKVGIGIKETFWGLFGYMNDSPNFNRRLLSSCFYIWFAF